MIARNAGYEPGLVVRKVLSVRADEGFDASRGEYVNMIEAGIIDPAKVVRCALQNASSVAGTAALHRLPDRRHPGEEGRRRPRGP